jgi:hypothetical protein
LFRKLNKLLTKNLKATLMEEEKIIKHTGDAAHALLKKNVSWKKKMQEFFLRSLLLSSPSALHFGFIT